MDFEEVLKKRHSVRKFQDRQIRQETLMQIVAQAFVKYPDIIRKRLDIPGSEEIVIGIGLGYEDEVHNENRCNDRNRGRSDRYGDSSQNGIWQEDHSW